METVETSVTIAGVPPTYNLRKLKGPIEKNSGQNSVLGLERNNENVVVLFCNFQAAQRFRQSGQMEISFGGQKYKLKILGGPQQQEATRNETFRTSFQQGTNGDTDEWRKTLYVTRIPLHLHTYPALKYHFERFGLVRRLFLKDNKRFAQVTFENHTNAVTAKYDARNAGPNSTMQIEWNKNEAPPRVEQPPKPRRKSSEPGNRQGQNFGTGIREASNASTGNQTATQPKPSRPTPVARFDVIHYWHTFSELPAPGGTRCLLAQNITSAATVQKIMMHFENKKRSNGGPVDKILKMVDGVLVIFQNIEDCDSSLEKKDQVFDGKELKIYPKVVPTCHDNRMVLKGVGEKTTLDTLELYLENCSDNETSPKLCEKQTLPGIYLIDYGDFDATEADSIIDAIQTKSLEGSKIQASRLMRTDCIKVMGVAATVSSDAIRLVFESKKRTNGGPVTRVDRINEDTALVYFAVFTDAENVCARFSSSSVEVIVVGGNPVTVKLYYHSLSNDHENVKGIEQPQQPEQATTNIPTKAKSKKPLEEVHLQPKCNENIIRFIRQSRKTYDELKAAFSDICSVNGSGSSVDDAKTFGFMSKKGISIITQKEFEDECRKRLADFVAKYSHGSGQFEKKKLAEARSLDLYPQLDESYKGNGQDFSVSWKNGSVFVTGLRAAAEQVLADIKKSADCIVKNMEVNADKFSVMTFCGLVDEVRQKHQNVRIKCDEKKSEILISGSKDDVSAAQIDSLTLMQNIEVKKITGLDDSVVRFLSESFKDSDELKTSIQNTLRGRNIKAYLSLESDEPCLKVRGDSDFQNALSAIKGLICIDQISTDEPTAAVLTSKAWKAFHQSLRTMKTCKAYIKADGSILMVGLASPLKSLRKKIEDFLEQNVIRRSVVRMSYGGARFIVEHSKDFTAEECERKSINCGLTSENGGGVFVQGKRQSMDEAVKVMNTRRTKITEVKHTLHEPGMRDYYRGKDGQEFLKATERVNHCVILTESKDCAEWLRASIQQASQPKAAARKKSAPKGTQVASVTLACGTVLQVWKTNIIEHRCDVMINASNPELRLLPGGVSGVIIKMDTEGGRPSKIQKELDDIIKKNYGDLLAGDAVTTSSGCLTSCKKIVHAIGPRWNSTTEKSDPNLILKSCIHKSLKEVDQYGLSSVAIPAISCGIFGGEARVCIPLIIETVVEYFKEEANSSIERVDFVEISNQGVIDEFEKHVKKLKASNPTPRPQPPMPTLPHQPRPAATNTSLATNLVQGDISIQTADVVVNITSPQAVANMQGSAVSKALLRRAGAQVLQECAQIPAPHNLGNVFETSGGQLPCKRLYHGVVAHYNPANSENIVKAVVSKSLQMADQAGYRSIVFPAIATGGFQHPPQDVARWMREEISSFAPNSLQAVKIVLYPGNAQAIQAFMAEFSSPSPTKTPSKPKKFFAKPMAASSQTAGATTATFGPLTVNVVQGDITQNPSDVIVNSTNVQFDLSQGLVSKAIIRRGGAQIQNEVNAETSTEYRLTSGGSLPCEAILHAIVPDSDKKIQKCIVKMLEIVEKRGFSSVALPALGTGNIGLEASSVGEVMRKAFEEYSKKNPNPANLNVVNVVIFDQSKLQDFQTAILNQPANPSQPGLLTKFVNFTTNLFSSSHTPPVDESLDIFFYSTNREDIEQAKKCILDETKKMTKTMVIEDDAIPRLTEWEKWEIAKIVDDHKVKISDVSNRYLKQFKVDGLTSNVVKANDAIKDVLKNFSAAETTASFVTWEKKRGARWDEFAPRSTHVLEKAFKARNGNKSNTQLNKITVPEFHGDSVKKLSVDLTNLENDVQGCPAPSVRRKVKEKAADDTPSNWDDMQGKQIRHIQLVQGSAEYQTVLTKFQANGTFHSTIVSIERIQNLSLYRQFVAKQYEVTNKLQGTGKTIVRELFHGTTEADKIATQGFDRSFAGRNATAFGKGVYFATTANYSHGYAAPNSQGHRRMFLANVVTGEFCPGNSGMIVPPPLPNSSMKNQLHDSVVDNVATPSIFVIFKDASAYPTYLITYQ